MISLLFALALSTKPLECQVIRGDVHVRLSDHIDPSIRYIAVVRSGKWRSIVDEHTRLAKFPTKTVVMSVKLQKAVEYRNGRAVQVAAFPRPGSYKLVFTDNLETEPEEMASISCMITVSP